MDYLQENACDVAFLDIKMRGMTGLDLARQIKGIHSDVNIVFVTGYSEYALDALRLYASDYLLKPATPETVERSLRNLRRPVVPKHEKRVYFKCFGSFEVYVDGQPLSFKRAKSKELLAYLVDRAGAAITMRELVAVLWENKMSTASVQSNVRNVVADMRNTLSEAGVGSIIKKDRNAIALDCELVDCDYYDYLRHASYSVNNFHGEYMAQYSWAEVTAASLAMHR